jgi:hypothetical protein
VSQPLVSLVPQRHMADCGVAVLAMFLAITYEDALLALGGEVPSILRRGVWMPELQRAASRLGVTLRLRRRFDASEDDGIVRVQFKNCAHVVLLRNGLIFDTTFEVWEPEDYRKAKRVRFGSILVRDGDS